MSNQKRYKIKVFLSIISVFLIFGITEIILRLTNFHIDFPSYLKFHPNLQIDPQLANGYMLKDPVLFWRLTPFYNQVNSRGFRGTEFSIKKQEGKFRIICIGDSVTYGARGREEASYPRQLERILHSGISTNKFEVINAGVPGYTSFQGLPYLRNELIKYQPDLITVHFGGDDAGPALYFEDKEQKMLPSYLLSLQNSLIKSKIYQLLSKIIFIARNTYFAKYPQISRGFKARVDPRDYNCNLKEMANIARKNNIKIVFIPPLLYDNGIVHTPRRYLPFDKNYTIKLEERFKEENNLKELFLDECHFTSEGNRIVAEEIKEFLIKQKIIQNYL